MEHFAFRFTIGHAVLMRRAAFQITVKIGQFR
jgi:hypothetical protein